MAMSASMMAGPASSSALPSGNASGTAAAEATVTRAGVAGKAGPLSAVQRRAIENGPLVPNQAAYARAKAAATAGAAAGGSSAVAAPSSSAPVLERSWLGLTDTTGGPSDSTGAIGTTRYIELVNRRFGIYSRTSNTALSTGSLAQLVGAAAGANVFDPQVIWDPSTSRFYYVTDTVFSDTDNRVSFGFSTTASPTSSADFCKYEVSHGDRFPDYPKLGDLGGAGNTGLVMYGTNTFSGVSGSFLTSEIWAITKPPAGTACPAPSVFTLSRVGTPTVFTPVPANQTDTSSTGDVVANAQAKPSTVIPTFRATKNVSNQLVLSAVRNVAVPSYGIPAAAQQGGTTRRLDTLDTRHTQAVSAIDPARGGVRTVWTQHTIAGGAGAQVRWYQINPNPTTSVLLQSGTISGASTGVAGRYVYNGAISPDRQRNGATARFGSNMVVGFNTSSTTQFVDIRMGSKVGAAATTFAATPVRTSTAGLNDFTCTSGTCRWGDYAAATPDPATVSTATRGRVWLTSGFVRATGGPSAAGWGTWNWSAAP